MVRLLALFALLALGLYYFFASTKESIQKPFLNAQNKSQIQNLEYTHRQQQKPQHNDAPTTLFKGNQDKPLKIEEAMQVYLQSQSKDDYGKFIGLLHEIEDKSLRYNYMRKV